MDSIAPRRPAAPRPALTGRGLRPRGGPGRAGCTARPGGSLTAGGRAARLAPAPAPSRRAGRAFPPDWDEPDGEPGEDPWDDPDEEPAPYSR